MRPGDEHDPLDGMGAVIWMLVAFAVAGAVVLFAILMRRTDLFGCF
jgi:hypothetical protein